MKLKFIYSFVFVILLAGLVYSQTLPNSFYLSQDKKMYKTTGNSPISSNSISDIITFGDTIWVGTGQGVNLSTDNGNTWKKFTNDNAFGTESISAIGYYKGIFWAATAHDENTSQGSVQTGSGIRYTTDDGNTWIKIPQPVDADSDSVAVYGIDTLKALPVIVPEQNLIFDLAFTPGTIWEVSWAGGLRRAPIDSLLVNPDYKWQRVILPPDNLNSIKPTDTLNFSYSPRDYLNLRGFSIITINDSTIYVGTADGINKTTNANNEFPSWVKYTNTNETNPISGNFVVALGYQRYNNTVWAATWPAEGANEFYAVSFSSDGGANWQTSLSGEKVHNFGFNDNENQVIATSDNGAFRTKDKGANWILPNSIVDENTGLTLNTTAFYAAAFQGNYVWLGSSEGLARLDEISGSMWSGNWDLYFASRQLTSSSDSYAYPNPFNPNTDILKIKYDIKEASESVTIRIFDFSMHYLRTIIQNVSRGTSHSVDQSGGVIDYWDGKDADGKTVPNGVYFYRIDAGSQNPIYGKILVIH